jgi:hypothetical protein
MDTNYDVGFDPGALGAAVSRSLGTKSTLRGRRTLVQFRVFSRLLSAQLASVGGWAL